MSVVYTIKTARPSTMHLYWFELADDGDIFSLTNPVWIEKNLLSLSYDDPISWDHISQRMSELRPDTVDMCGNKTFKELVDEGSIPLTPPYNPFTITHIAHLNFKNLEHFKQIINSAPKNLIIDSIEKTENSITEESLNDEEGNSLQDMLTEYSLVNR